MNSARFSPDGTKIVSAGGDYYTTVGDGTVRVWDAVAGKCVQIMHGHCYGVWSVGFSPDGTKVFSGAGKNRFDGDWLAGHEVTLSESDNGSNTVRLWDATIIDPLAATDTTMELTNAGFNEREYWEEFAANAARELGISIAEPASSSIGEPTSSPPTFGRDLDGLSDRGCSHQ